MSNQDFLIRLAERAAICRPLENEVPPRYAYLNREAKAGYQRADGLVAKQRAC
jgi:hypothetical protein